jgi:hypothetical protein
MTRAIGVAAFLVATAALAQIELPDGYILSGPGAATANGNFTGNTQFGTIQFTHNLTGVCTLVSGSGGCINYDTAISYVVLNGDLLISTTAQALNITATGLNHSIELQQTSGNVALDLQTAGAEICLANGTDCISDSSGTATFSGAISSGINAVTGGNGFFANTVAGGNNVFFGYNGSSFSADALGLDTPGSNRTALDATGSTNTNEHIDLKSKGAGDIVLPKIADASLLTCTASTEDATHSPAGATAFASTNNAHVTCNGTRWVYDDLWTTCTMVAGVTCTATVPSGTSCICMSSSSSSSPLGSSCAVAATTATCTSTVSNSDVWNVVVH